MRAGDFGLRAQVEGTEAGKVAVGRTTSFPPDFPDGSISSAWRLRHFPGKPSFSDDFLPKRPRFPMGDSQNTPAR
jgi:hypothetical protein